MKKPRGGDSRIIVYTRIFFVVSLYWVVSISTVFVNKTLLSQLELDVPMFVAFFQVATSATIYLVLEKFSLILPQWFKFSKPTAFDPQTIKNVLPLAVLFTCMIATNNLCLKYVSVGFYYIGRSLTTIFNVIFTFAILGERTSSKCIVCCAIIIFGFYLGVDQENMAGSLSVLGTIFGILGSLSLSLYSIFTKKLLPSLNQDVWLLSYYNNIYSSILFFVLMVLNGELGELHHHYKALDTYFWLIMSVGGLCGFAVGIATSLQIKYTSALTHNVSGTAKACAQTVLASYWYAEVKSVLWWLSNLIILLGSAGYTRVKQVEMERAYRTTNAVYQKV